MQFLRVPPTGNPNKKCLVSFALLPIKLRISRAHQYLECCARRDSFMRKHPAFLLFHACRTAIIAPWARNKIFNSMP
jgi:hypothetical protein